MAYPPEPDEGQPGLVLLPDDRYGYRYTNSDNLIILKRPDPPRPQRVALDFGHTITVNPGPKRSWAATIAACAVGKSVGDRSTGLPSSSTGTDSHDHIRESRFSRTTTLMSG